MDPAIESGARVVVAMSGGVDSSVTAALLAESGFDVIGITLQLYDHGSATGRKGACCAGQDIRDARAVCDQLGIPHYVLDMEERFREAVIDDFVETYGNGQTPVPCIRCNQSVKFTDLLQTARELGASALATGHYVRRVPDVGGVRMYRARDKAKDQSYFLFATTREQLDYCRFPLGDLEKNETRAHAERLALPVARKPESQDICFVPQGHYSSLLRKLRPDAMQQGDIVHVDGKVLGRHQGVGHYTVGQRRGLEVSTGERLYVVEIDRGRHRILVGPRKATLSRSMELRNLNLLAEMPDVLGVSAKHRYNEPAVAARFHHAQGILEFAEPQSGIAKGQAAVLYDGDRVLGGGWIHAAHPC
ncbi:MAG: tRNA 2-thiouridine(34) synthase MnmA [Geminicoccaceae bacterium]|nr:tRNA 2-thiouridine(34) synthase MnmA [Geminicoccaceae bacterium]